MCNLKNQIIAKYKSRKNKPTNKTVTIQINDRQPTEYEVPLFYTNEHIKRYLNTYEYNIKKLVIDGVEQIPDENVKLI